MARKKKHKRQQQNVLESVFGIKLEGGDGDHASPTLSATPDPAAVEARAEEIAQRRERASYAALIRTTAAEAAREVGIRKDRARGFVKLLDLSGVSVSSDGEPDTTEIARIVRAGVDEFPELRARGTTAYGSASRYPGGGNS
jgi:hypothetical protein